MNKIEKTIQEIESKIKNLIYYIEKEQDENEKSWLEGALASQQAILQILKK